MVQFSRKMKPNTREMDTEAEGKCRSAAVSGTFWENSWAMIKTAFKNHLLAGRWWRTLLIPALGKQKQVCLCEFEASLAYKS